VEWYWQGKAEVLRDKPVTVRNSPGSNRVRRDERPAANGWDMTLFPRWKWLTQIIYGNLMPFFQRNHTLIEWQTPTGLATYSYMFGSGMPYLSPWHKSAPAVCWGTGAKLMNSPCDKNRTSERWTNTPSSVVGNRHLSRSFLLTKSKAMCLNDLASIRCLLLYAQHLKW
jgi:hypothetical protein